MLKLFLLILAAAAAFAADDPWQKVKDLKSGADLRVFRRGQFNLCWCRWANLPRTI